MDGVLVGTWAGGSSLTPLTVSFNSDATVARVQKVYQGITFRTNTDNPVFGVRTLSVSMTDGDGGTSNTATATVDVDTAQNDDPSFTALDDNPTFIEAGTAVVLDTDVDVADPELDYIYSGNGNYSGSSLTLVRNGGVNSDDVFSFNDGNGISLAGGNLIKNAQVIATFDTLSTTGELVITFTDANGEIPTSADVDNILRQITYSNTNDNPAASVQIDWTFDDGNTGSQGINGAKTATGSTTVNITATNDAPLLDNTGTMALTSITEDDLGNGGNTVAQILASAGGDRVTDVDVGAVEGVAITTRNNGNGQWQYSIDGGSNWTNVGTVNESSALLLRSTDLVRFQPDGDNGITQTIEFRAWDQTSGTAGTKVDTTTNGGSTAFSVTIESASITVSSINDDPTNAGTLPSDISVTEDIASNVDLSAIDLADVDHGGGNLTITLSTSTGGSCLPAMVVGSLLAAAARPA